MWPRKTGDDKTLQKLLKVSSEVAHITSTHHFIVQTMHKGKPDHDGAKHKVLPQGDPRREGQKLFLNNNKMYHRAEE